MIGDKQAGLLSALVPGFFRSVMKRAVFCVAALLGTSGVRVFDRAAKDQTP